MGLVAIAAVLWLAYQVAPASTKAKLRSDKWVASLASLALIVWVFRGGSLWIAGGLVLLWALGRLLPAFLRGLRG